MGSFQAWVNMIGGILERGFLEGFLANAQALQEQDEDALQWLAFLHAWHAHYGRNQILLLCSPRKSKQAQYSMRSRAR